MSRVPVKPDAYALRLREELDRAGVALVGKAPYVLYVASPRDGNPFGAPAGQDAPVLICDRLDYKAVCQAHTALLNHCYPDPPFLTIGWWPEKDE